MGIPCVGDPWDKNWQELRLLDVHGKTRIGTMGQEYAPTFVEFPWEDKNWYIGQEYAPAFVGIPWDDKNWHLRILEFQGMTRLGTYVRWIFYGKIRHRTTLDSCKKTTTPTRFDTAQLMQAKSGQIKRPRRRCDNRKVNRSIPFGQVSNVGGSSFPEARHPLFVCLF